MPDIVIIGHSADFNNFSYFEAPYPPHTRLIQFDESTWTALVMLKNSSRRNLYTNVETRCDRSCSVTSINASFISVSLETLKLTKFNAL